MEGGEELQEETATKSLEPNRQNLPLQILTLIFFPPHLRPALLHMPAVQTPVCRHLVLSLHQYHSTRRRNFLQPHLHWDFDCYFLTPEGEF